MHGGSRSRPGTACSRSRGRCGALKASTTDSSTPATVSAMPAAIDRGRGVDRRSVQQAWSASCSTASEHGARNRPGKSAADLGTGWPEGSLSRRAPPAPRREGTQINKLMKEQYGVDSMPETAENVAAGRTCAAWPSAAAGGRNAHAAARASYRGHRAARRANPSNTGTRRRTARRRRASGVAARARGRPAAARPDPPGARHDVAAAAVSRRATPPTMAPARPSAPSRSHGGRRRATPAPGSPAAARRRGARGARAAARPPAPLHRADGRWPRSAQAHCNKYCDEHSRIL